MGYITIRKTSSDKLTIDNAFSKFAVVNHLTREIRSITVEELVEYIKKSGARGNLQRATEKSVKKAKN